MESHKVISLMCRRCVLLASFTPHYHRIVLILAKLFLGHQLSCLNCLTLVVHILEVTTRSYYSSLSQYFFVVSAWSLILEHLLSNPISLQLLDNLDLFLLVSDLAHHLLVKHACAGIGIALRIQ